MRAKIVTRFSIFILINLLLAGCNKNVDAEQIAPDFSLTDLSGNKVSLRELRGHTVLLDFWATWCPPCLYSIPELIEIQKKYKDRGVVVLGISMDDPQAASDRYLSQFKEKLKINYKILRANSQIVQDYFRNERMAIPTMFIINHEGKIVDKHVGFAPGAVEKSIKKLL